jgi:hypothetical protein
VSSFHDERLKRALGLLSETGDRPMTFDDLRAAGIENPAATIYELEIAGEPIEHVRGGVRLGAGPRTVSSESPRRRSRWSRRAPRPPGA